MTVVLDDRLLRDHVTDRRPPRLAALLDEHPAATTNLYLFRLARSAVDARGRQLTGSWPVEERRALGRRLATVAAAGVRIVPMQDLVVRMAELSATHRLSALGAEAVAAAEHLGATLCVSERDDGPGVRSAAAASGVAYEVVPG